MSQPPYPPPGGNEPERERTSPQGWNTQGGSDQPTEQFGHPGADPAGQRDQTQQFGQPGQFGQPQQPPYGQQPYGQPQYGGQQQPPYGQQPQYGQPPYGGQPQYGQQAYGQPGAQQWGPGGPGGQPPKSNKNMVIALVVGGVVLIAAIAVTLFLVLGNDDEPTRTAGGSTSDSPESSEDPDSGDPFPAGQPPGDFGDAEHNQLAEACFEGDWTSCDDLYWATDVGTEAEEYGATCGGRNEADGGHCVDLYGDGGSDEGGSGGFGDVPADLPAAGPAPTGNADFQEAADNCEAGLVVFCDILKLAGLGGDPALEAYGEYGFTCGGRNAPTEESCVDLYR